MRTLLSISICLKGGLNSDTARAHLADHLRALAQELEASDTLPFARHEEHANGYKTVIVARV